MPVVLIVKAGHNAEEHNHNDVGSFLLHVAGENLLTDPGRGLYSRDYFGPRRYENIFANSYGHSVPCIDGQLQGTGRAFSGVFQESMDACDAVGEKRISLELAAAYPCPDLLSARRELCLITRGAEAGDAWLHDHFQFAQGNHQVEEALITWLDCEVNGAIAILHGQHHNLRLSIEQPPGLQFCLERLEEQSQANHKTRTLKRLTFALPERQVIDVYVRMQILGREGSW